MQCQRQQCKRCLFTNPLILLLCFCEEPRRYCYCSCQIVIQHWLAPAFNPPPLPPFLATFSRNKKYGLLLGVYGIAEPLVRIGNTLALDLAFKGLWLLQAGVPWLPDKPYRDVGAVEAEGALPSFKPISTRGRGEGIIPTP